MAATSTAPTLYEYFDAAFQASLDGSIGSDITPLPYDVTIYPDGFGGMAFMTPDNNLIVAFAGTDFKQALTDPEFLIPQIVADYQIYEGESPNAYQDGVDFTNQAIAMAKEAAAQAGTTFDPSNTYVVGHSLGGAIAAYVTAQLGLRGTTFAGPGLAPGDIPETADDGNVTAYVEYGDPIGNYGSNPNLEGSFLVNPSDGPIVRFGTTTYVGNGNFIDEGADLAALVAAGATYGENKDLGLVALAALALAHHPLTDYATDLGIPSPPSTSGEPGISVTQLVSLVQQALGDQGQYGGSEESVAVAFNPNARFVNPTTAVLTGTVSNPSSLSSLEIYSVSSSTGVLADLGTATVNGNGTWFLRDPIGADTQSGFVAVATSTDGEQSSAIAGYDLTGGIRRAPYTALQSNYASDGTPVGQNFYGARGELYLATAVTTNPDGSSTTLRQGGRFFVGLPYYAAIEHDDADGNLVERDLRFKNGSTTIQGFAGNQTLQSIRNDAFYPTGSGNTFVFTPGFGQDLVTGFNVRGSDHDTISLSSASFDGIADVLRNTRDSFQGAVITDRATGDTITVAGVSKAELAHNRRDFTFAA